MNPRFLRLLSIAIPVLSATILSAEVTLPKVLSDHMVIQRNLPVHVWGWATAGEPVSVTFRGNARSTTANDLGQWSLYLPPGEAGGPFPLTIQGASKITLDDVLVGDVWVASGQSNMEFRLRQASTAAEDLPKAANDRIRLMIVKIKASDYPLTDVQTAGWTASTPDSAKDFSAVAWYFAREIEQREHVPVGVIDSTWGGTVAEAWTRLAAIGEDAALAPIFTSWGHMTERESTALLEEAPRQKLREEARAPGQARTSVPLAPNPRFLGSRHALERHDRAPHPIPHSRRPLVSG